VANATGVLACLLEALPGASLGDLRARLEA
jgi:hypothetical protein